MTPRALSSAAVSPERVVPVTACPAPSSSGTSRRPMAPAAPARNTFIATPRSLGSLCVYAQCPRSGKVRHEQLVRHDDARREMLLVHIAADGGERRAVRREPVGPEILAEGPPGL